MLSCALLQFRGPWLLAISGLGGFICAAWLLLFLVNLDRERIKSHSLCIAGEWITWLAYPAFVLPYALRVYRLHRVFAVAESHRHGRYDCEPGLHVTIRDSI